MLVLIRIHSINHGFEETGKALKIPLLVEFPFPLPQNGKKVI